MRHITACIHVSGCKPFTWPASLPPAGELALVSVVFSYPSRPTACVLNGLSLAVRPGEVVALVGASGGGKSSIIKLLQRYYVPGSGQVGGSGGWAHVTCRAEAATAAWSCCEHRQAPMLPACRHAAPAVRHAACMLAGLEQHTGAALPL